MVHKNRGRLTVDPDGNWRLYTDSIPGGCKGLGTVTRDGETGALVITESGIYSMLNARVYRALDQSKVAAALSPEDGRGRPSEMTDGKRRNIYIDTASWETALRLGDGNASVGIRKAIALANEKE